MSANAEATVTLSLIDRVTGPIKRIGARLSALSKRIGFDRIGTAVTNLGNRLRGLGDGLAATSRRLGAFLGLLGVGGAGAITAAYGLAKSAADVGAEVFDMAGKLGIGVEQLQEYRFAAKMSGVEVAAFDKGVEKLGINAVEATKGNKQMAAAFKALGVRVKGTGGQMRTTEEILDDTMSALSSIKDPLKRNQLAFKVFGKSGVELTKILSDGASGLRALREEARRTGNVFSADATRAADELGDNVDALKERFAGLKNFIGIQLLPIVNDAVKGMTKWYDANAQMVRSEITGWVKRLGGFIKDLLNPASELRQNIKSLSDGFSDAIATIKPFVDFLGGPFKAALALIAFWVLAPTIAAVVALAGAFTTLSVAVAGVATSAIGLAFSGFAKLFTGMAGTAATSGAAAGTAYGTAFSKSMRGAVRLGLLGLGAYTAMQIIGDMPSTKEQWDQRIKENKSKDEERNNSLMSNGGNQVNKALGFEFLRGKDDFQNSPANKLLQGIKGIFSSAAKPSTGVASVGSTLALDSAVKARQFGFGRTTENLPGKTKDDLTAVNVTMPEPIIAHEPQTITVSSPTTIHITGVPLDNANAIAAAVGAQLAARDKQSAAAVKSSLSD
jgi:hypothetical protein